MTQHLPQVGLGVIILNDKDEVLLGRRIGSHAEKWSIPGGKLELGETFEDGGTREVEEEHGIRIISPEVIAITNNLETYRQEGIHFISVILVARTFEGEPSILEPNKCAEIGWFNPAELPQPHFDASRLAIECFMQDKPYTGIST